MVNTNTEEHKSCCLNVVQEQGFEKKKDIGLLICSGRQDQKN